MWPLAIRVAGVNTAILSRKRDALWQMHLWSAVSTKSSPSNSNSSKLINSKIKNTQARCLWISTCVSTLLMQPTEQRDSWHGQQEQKLWSEAQLLFYKTSWLSALPCLQLPEGAGKKLTSLNNIWKAYSIDHWDASLWQWRVYCLAQGRFDGNWEV